MDTEPIRLQSHGFYVRYCQLLVMHTCLQLGDEKLDFASRFASCIYDAQSGAGPTALA